MNENLRAFLAQAGEDEAWRAELAKLEDKQAAVEACLAKAAELGLTLAAEDFDEPAGELSEDELAAVAGAGDCMCMLGGGGTKDDGALEDRCWSPFLGYVDTVCACVVYGEGWADELSPMEGDYDEYQRCICPMVGEGEGMTTSYYPKG